MRDALTLLLVVSVAGCGALLELDRYEHEKGSQSTGSAGSAGAGAMGGGGGASGGAGTGGAGAGSPCSVYADVVCGQFGECYPHLLEQLIGDAAACKSRYILFCEAVLAASDTSWTERGVGDCSTSIAGTTCEGVLAMLFDVGPAACNPGPGTKAAGDSCYDDYQCVGSFCKRAFSVCGVCASKLPVDAVCDHPLDCEVGLLCAGGKCVVAGQYNDACDTTTAPCRFPLICKSSVCTNGGKADEPCAAAPDDCNPFLGLYCDPQALVCKTTVLTPPMDPCGFVGSELHVCGDGGLCAASACVAPAADGAACDAFNGPPCLVPALCDAGTCTLPSNEACP